MTPGLGWKGARRLGGASLLLSVLAVLLYVVPSATGVLQYDRTLIAGGEVWRWVTGHWVHASVDQLCWDVLAFLVLGTVAERMGRRLFGACVVGAALLIPPAVWVLLPGMEVYLGLSGIDSALFALVAARLWREGVRRRDWVLSGSAAAGLLVFLAKVGFEFATGSTMFMDAEGVGMVSVPLAHVVGAAVGMALGLGDAAVSRAFGGRPAPSLSGSLDR